MRAVRVMRAVVPFTVATVGACALGYAVAHRLPLTGYAGMFLLIAGALVGGWDLRAILRPSPATDGVETATTAPHSGILDPGAVTGAWSADGLNAPEVRYGVRLWCYRCHSSLVYQQTITLDGRYHHAAMGCRTCGLSYETLMAIALGAS